MYVQLSHVHAWGQDRWKIYPKEFKGMKEAKAYLEETGALHDCFGCGDKCRGVEIKVVRTLPAEWIRERIGNLKVDIEAGKQEILNMERQIVEFEKKLTPCKYRGVGSCPPVGKTYDRQCKNCLDYKKE